MVAELYCVREVCVQQGELGESGGARAGGEGEVKTVEEGGEVRGVGRLRVEVGEGLHCYLRFLVDLGWAGGGGCEVVDWCVDRAVVRERE